ncbi:MAG: M20/M25/M40 family metallo-hydrolase [Deinococcales bacterium]
MLDVLKLSQDLIAIPSASQISNRAIGDYLEDLLSQDFELERLSYFDDRFIVDGKAVEKVSLVAKRGQGSGGIAFFSHTDTVPGAEDAWQPYEGMVQDGKLYGRGSCDMKGPLAATLLAAQQMSIRDLKKPVYLILTADEEMGFLGAKQVVGESQLLSLWPDMGVIAEPTCLRPVYAHKGGHHIIVTAHGLAAHTSTDQGISANFLIAPFLAEMAEMAKIFKTDSSFMNPEFSPPTNGFNMTLSDGNCAANVTAAKTICTLNFRDMPQSRSQDIIEMISRKAQNYGFEVEARGFEAFYTDPQSEIIKLSLLATGTDKAIAVPYGTEALIYQDHLPLVILGPGDIAQAHTVGEWIELRQLTEAQHIYQSMIRQYCC